MKSILILLIFSITLFANYNKIWEVDFENIYSDIYLDFDNNIVASNSNNFVVEDLVTNSVKKYPIKYNNYTKFKKVSNGFVRIANNMIIKYSKHYDYMWEVPFNAVLEPTPLLAKKSYSNVDTLSVNVVDFIEGSNGNIIALCDSVGVVKVVNITSSGDISFIKSIKLDNNYLDAIGIVKLKDGYAVASSVGYSFYASSFYLFKLDDNLNITKQQFFDNQNYISQFTSNNDDKIIIQISQNDIFYAETNQSIDAPIVLPEQYKKIVIDNDFNTLNTKIDSISLINPYATNNYYLASIYTNNGYKLLLFNYNNEIIDTIDYFKTQPFTTIKNDSLFILSNSSIYLYKNSSSTNEELVQKKLNVKIYPNPFNPTTTILFNNNSTQRITINLYNINGKLVQKIATRNFAKGTNQIKISGSNLATGVYFVKLKSNNFNVSKKLILIK